MVKRLNETGLIGEEELKKFLLESDDSITRYKKRYALSSLKSDSRIDMDTLAELAVNAFESDLVTYEKLEYLLGLCGLKPEDFGIKNNTIDSNVT
ncbi:MAG: hypothetical protein K2K09_04015 [Lachnospiraceae bacterium]|nr:hypothetical protein [Lachnospiraceae bacterium]